MALLLLYFIRRWFPGVCLTLCCFVVYSTRRFVLCLTLCHFVLVFFSPFSIAITSLGEEKANLSVFRMFVRFVLCLDLSVSSSSYPLSVWEGLRFVIVALPGLFSYLFFFFFFFSFFFFFFFFFHSRLTFCYCLLLIFLLLVPREGFAS